MIGVMLHLMKSLNYWISLKKAFVKIRKITTFPKQYIDNKLSLRCYDFGKSIFVGMFAFT